MGSCMLTLQLCDLGALQQPIVGGEAVHVWPHLHIFILQPAQQKERW